MANTVVVYPGDGVTRQFTVPFDYLNRTFVRVYLDDIEETQGTTWSFISPTVIECAVAPAAGEALTIRRVTSPNRVVDFKDASVLRSLDLNTAQLQVLHIAEEAKDMIVDTISTDRDGNLDARWRRIVHVSNPVEDGDALNFGTYKADLNGAVVARDRAEAAATKAEASEAAAKNYANTASSHKTAAEGSETAAKESETAASTAATTATNAAAAASTSASKAETEALAAKNHANTASSHKDAAKGSMTAAEGWANQAKIEADRAKTAADSVDTSVFDSRVSALENEDILINSKVTALTTRVGNTETDITSLDARKLNKSGGDMTGDLAVRGGTLRNSFDNLNFNTSTSTQGLKLEWTDGTGKTWDNATNATGVYHELLKRDAEWMAGMGGIWKVNGEITAHTLHLTSSGKLMVDLLEARYVKNSFVNSDNSLWFRIWSDNWIEQGGTFVVSGDTTLNFVTPFASATGEGRNIIATPTNGDYRNLVTATIELSNTQFKITSYAWGGAVRFSWRACGF